MVETYTTLEDYHAFLMEADLDANYAEIDKKITSLECHSNKLNKTTTPLEAYMQRLQPNTSSYNAISFYFQQAFYLNDKIIEHLLDELDQKLTSHDDERGEERDEVNLTFILSRTDEPEFNLTFQIHNQDELEYARRLVKLSKQYVRPYMAENEKKLAELSENYRRVFALVSEGDNQFTSGKSVHTTQHTRNICVHSLCSRRDRLVRQSIGHLSHFRRFFVFRKYFVFNIKQLVFDFNYFNCFVKPVLNKY